MKTFFLLGLICLSTQSIRAQVQEIETAKKAGLVSYLTAVKALGEFKMLTLIQDTQYVSKKNEVRAKVRDFNSKYNVLKLTVDKLINQISADAYNANRLQSYRAVNNLLKSGKSLPGKYDYYKEMVLEIDLRIETFLFSKYGSLQGASLSDITGVVEQAIGAITAASEMREKKIQSITALLKEQKLKSLGDLKPKESKEE